MKKTLLAGLVIFLAAGCIVHKQKRREVSLDARTAGGVVEIPNLDFPPMEIWEATIRGLRSFFATHKDHPYWDANDLNVCYPNGQDKRRDLSEKPAKIIRTFHIPITYEEPIVGKEFARRATVLIKKDGETAWRVRILLEKCERPRLPLKKKNEGWVADSEPDIINALAISKNVHDELQKIQRNKRLGNAE